MVGEVSPTVYARVGSVALRQVGLERLHHCGGGDVRPCVAVTPENKGILRPFIGQSGVRGGTFGPLRGNAFYKSTLTSKLCKYNAVEVELSTSICYLLKCETSTQFEII